MSMTCEKQHLTVSWSCIWGSFPVYGPHHAAQMSHSPRQPHQAGPKTQETFAWVLKTLPSSLPGDLWVGEMGHTEREPVSIANNFNTYYLTDAHWQVTVGHSELHVEKLRERLVCLKAAPMWKDLETTTDGKGGRCKAQRFTVKISLSLRESPHYSAQLLLHYREQKTPLMVLWISIVSWFVVPMLL